MRNINKKTFKNIYLFFSSILIFLIHLPFVFAKSRNVMPVSDDLQPVKKETRYIDTLFNGIKDSLVHAPKNIYDSLKLNTLGMAHQAFDLAMSGLNKLKAAGKIANDHIISIIDFSQPSSHKRLYVIDLQEKKVLFNTYVAHGLKSGQEMATEFSNTPESNKSSLGFYTTMNTYHGRNGYSLRLNGLERGFNDNALNRDIVVHGADYVNTGFINSQGWIGRSWGCPAVEPRLTRPIIETIKGGTCLFIYSPNDRYLRSSELARP